MYLINRVTAVPFIVAVTFTVSAISEELIPASFLPDAFNAVLSNIGSVGNIPLQAIESIPTGNESEIAGSNGDFSSQILLPQTEVESPLGQNIPFEQGELIQVQQLNQIVASSTATSSISGNRVEIPSSLNVTNSLIHSFNDSQIPITVSQNFGTASSIVQTINLQTGIEIPAAVTQ